MDTLQPTTYYVQTDDETPAAFFTRLGRAFADSTATIYQIGWRDGRLTATIYPGQATVDPVAIAWGQQRGLLRCD